ncbi:zinc finger protein 414 isoform X2 [Oncorhynchus keta]|uniref:zinc finger protein 414 isoform X2 n=1 Tax=Oncorhynchus keta TaxID=8018 RepID=UPI00227BDCA4|nr:zinc finger protein 414 isoform X2 [Oncorhynchus keta]
MSELVRLLSSSPVPPVDRSSPTTMSTGMASAPLLQPTSNTTQGQRMPCTLYGCHRVYTDTDSLAKHIKDHQNHIPTQSLPGKVFLCSFIGCNGSFPSMHHLMEHMRQHHKPNTYFLCQSCRSKLRSYRALLKHLHTCAKVAKSKAKAGEQAEVKPDPDPDAAVPMATDQETPQQQEPMESEPSHPVHGSTGSDHLSARAPSPYQPPEDGSLLGLDLNTALLPGAFSLQEGGGGGLSDTQPPGLTALLPGAFSLQEGGGGGLSDTQPPGLTALLPGAFSLQEGGGGGLSDTQPPGLTALLPGAFSLQEGGGGGLSDTQPPGLTALLPGAFSLQEGGGGGLSDTQPPAPRPHSFSQYLQSPPEVSGPAPQQQQQQRPPRPVPSALPSSPPPQPSTPPGSNARWRKNQDAPGSLRHRWTSPPPANHRLTRDGAQVSPSTAVFYGNTPGGATAVSSVATPPQTGRR